jgi:serine/threonine protein kinase
MNLGQNILFDNRFLLVKMLGKGSFSEVWLAEDTHVDNAQVAIKVFSPNHGLDENGEKLLVREFALLLNINHQNLIKPLYYSVSAGSPYIVLQYCKKGSASNLVGQMDENMVWKFIGDVASGLVCLHGQEVPIIHQDIKPDNILIDDRANFMITDFGISAKARSTLRRSMSANLSSAGTMAYMPPEKFSKDPTAIKASDIWALGASVFEMMTGATPFDDSLGGLAQQKGAEIPLIKGDWSEKLKDLVNRMLALNTWDRPTAEDLTKIATQKLDLTKSNQTILEQSSKESKFDKNNPKKKKRKTWWKVIEWIVLVTVLCLVFFLHNENYTGFYYKIQEHILSNKVAKTSLTIKAAGLVMEDENTYCLEFDCAAGFKSISVDYPELEWIILPANVSDYAKKWVSVKKTNDEAVIECLPNTDDEGRSISYVVTGTEKEAQQITLNIKQEGKPVNITGTWQQKLMKIVNHNPTETYSNGKYKGEMQYGKRHGFGIYFWGTGDFYIGSWENGNLNEGLYYVATHYVSNCEDCRWFWGKYDDNGDKSGYGVCYGINGKLLYVGEFKNDVPQAIKLDNYNYVNYSNFPKFTTALIAYTELSTNGKLSADEQYFIAMLRSTLVTQGNLDSDNWIGISVNGNRFVGLKIGTNGDLKLEASEDEEKNAIIKYNGEIIN